MDPEVVKALKLQQESHNQDIREQDEFYQAELSKLREVTDKLVLAAIGDGGGDNV